MKMKNTFLSLYYISETLTVLSELKQDKIVSNLCKILEVISQKDFKGHIYPEALKYYSVMCDELYKSNPSASLPNYIFDLILYNENTFSLMCARNKLKEISPHIIKAMKNDIKTLRLLASIPSKDFVSQFIVNNPALSRIQDRIPAYSEDFKYNGKRDIWEDYLNDFAQFYIKNGTGNFAKYNSFRVNTNGELVPVIHPDTVKLNDLKLYENQKQKAKDNMESFMSEHAYNNVLLYGDRGTGKSSCVKAIANEYSKKGLRIIQFDKARLIYLEKIMQKLAENPLKFLIFIDDLTLNEGDDNLGSLKAVLEGSVCVQPQNIVIYATSNRRHIIKESFSSREGDEVHREDTIDEIMSLSDRFGLMITYQMPSKEKFLEIVREIAKDKNIDMPIEEIEKGAEKFALMRGYRSPRIARQYLDLIYE